MPTPQMEEVVPQQQIVAVPAAGGSENPFSQLRKRLLKGFALNDPRSPQLNRTPLLLDEAIDRTLNMDDTFSDLFVETRAPATADPSADQPEPEVATKNSSMQIESFIYDEEETMPCDMILHATPPPAAPAVLESQIGGDPRSPSLGVERTPIIFCDDDDAEAKETQMLEHILETLTLNLSNESSSMASFVSASSEMMLDEPPQPQSQSRPANKHLERVRLGNKRRVPPRKPARANKPQIYVDTVTEGVTSTPKPTPNATVAQQQRTSRTPRTPLGCVNKNRIHLRSRSMEKDLRKTPLPLQSFDDQLNPTERINVPSLRLLMANTGENSPVPY